jgi:hypothetical protein
MRRPTQRCLDAVFLCIIAVLLSCPGCGGSSSLATNPNTPGGGARPGEAKLALTATAEGSDYRLALSAPGALDLYQIAGTLRFDAQRYTLISAEAGGGLGSPEACLFIGSEIEPGRVAFAYTKRFYGPGANGDISLLTVRITPKAGFKLSDFSLETGPGKLVVRDSKKQVLSVSMEAAL